MSKHIDVDALLAALYEADAITPRGAKIIREFPVAEAREPGEWLWDSDDAVYHCSLCHFNAYGNTGEILSGEYHYCPNCGADMLEADEEENNED